MMICRVVGHAVSTVKHQLLSGHKMLVCQQLDGEKTVGTPFIALDAVGAGEGDMVAVVQGRPGQSALADASTPVDAVIVAILDSYSFHGTTYKARQ